MVTVVKMTDVLSFRTGMFSLGDSALSFVPETKRTVVRTRPPHYGFRLYDLRIIKLAHYTLVQHSVMQVCG